VTNIQIYLQKKFHIFWGPKVFFLDLFHSCVLEFNLEKENGILLHGLLSSTPTQLMCRAGMIPFPSLCALLPCGSWVLVWPTYRPWPLYVGPAGQGILPPNLPYRVCAARRRNPPLLHPVPSPVTLTACAHHRGCLVPSCYHPVTSRRCALLRLRSAASP
jgi:hypothetical protein